jgi:hypothetical protein
MPNITIIRGLPGSGKSYKIKEHEHITGKTIVLDDYSVHHKNLDRLKYHLSKDEDISIADPWFCLPEKLDKLLDIIPEHYSVSILEFENNPEQCIKNAEKRYLYGDRRQVTNLIEHLTKYYKPREDMYTYKVYSDED